jgi:hypothetical protein
MKLVSKLVGSRILFYIIVILYILGIVLGGKSCLVCALLVATVPFAIIITAIIDSIIIRDYSTMIAGIMVLLLLIIYKVA